MDERVANEFGLNHAQMRYVQRAVPGNEKFGYSQALLGVDGEWRGIEVRALGREIEVIENTHRFGGENGEETSKPAGTRTIEPQQNGHHKSQFEVV
jgi:hypothetical protein